MDSIRPNPARRLKEALVVLAAGVLLFIGLLGLGTPRERDALIRDAVALQLLDGATEGRQALVGSIWWAPLPSLLRVPLIYAMQWMPEPNGSLLLAAICAVALLWLIYRFCRLRLARMESLYLVTALVLAPGFSEPVFYGATHHWNVLLAFSLLVAYHAWRREHSLRGLVLFGSVGGLIAVSGVDILLWAVVVFGLLALHELARRASGAEKRATLLLAGLPGLYVAGLWVLLNWLIMGAPLFFLRTWPAATPDAGAGWLPESLMPGIMVWFFYLIALSLLALVMRRGAVLCLAAATLAWLIPWYRFGHVGLTAMAFGGWLALTTGALVTTAVLAGTLDRRYARSRMALCLAPLALVVAMRSPRIPLDPPALRMVVDRPAQRHAMLDRVVARVDNDENRFVKVFVAGFEALHLLQGYPNDIFLPVLDFDVRQAVSDYHGYRLYVMVHRPEGVAALDGIHVRYPDLYRRGGPLTLYDSDWGPWRLYEITPQYRPPDEAE